jgi:CubicO group peptidase (beta-lactamase class C family)
MRKLIIGIYMLSTLLVSNVLNAQIIKRIDSLAKVHQARGFNGNVLYSKNDAIIFTGNYGYIDFESKLTLNDSTVFELASCSKQFTALAIIQLVEKKLITYDTKVQEIISDFPYQNITIEHLLRHQSGLPDYQKLFYNKKLWNRKKMATAQDVIDVLNKLKLDLSFEPGSQYEYDNTGYVVLGVVIEKVSRQSYENYIKEHIFIPTGMQSSRVDSIENDPENFENTAIGHTYNKRKESYQKAREDKNHKHLNWMRSIVGDAGIYASILDLEKWKHALRNNTLITEESKQIMFSTDDVSKKYGYGVAIYNTESKGKWVYHNGSWGGAKTMTLYLPESNEFLVILSNNRYEETYRSFEEELYKLIQ